MSAALDPGVKHQGDDFYAKADPLNRRPGLDPESRTEVITDNLIALDFWILDRSPGQAKLRMPSWSCIR